MIFLGTGNRGTHCHAGGQTEGHQRKVLGPDRSHVTGGSLLAGGLSRGGEAGIPGTVAPFRRHGDVVDKLHYVLVAHYGEERPGGRV